MSRTPAAAAETRSGRLLDLVRKLIALNCHRTIAVSCKGPGAADPAVLIRLMPSEASSGMAGIIQAGVGSSSLPPTAALEGVDAGARPRHDDDGGVWA